MERLIVLANKIIGIQYNKFASLEGYRAEFIKLASAFAKELATSYLSAIDPQTLLNDLNTISSIDRSQRASGAGPLFDSIFLNSYNAANDEIKGILYRFISGVGVDDSPESKNNRINVLMNEDIAYALMALVTLLRGLASKNGIDTSQQPYSEIFDDLDNNLSTDLNQSQIAIDLKNYILEIQTNLQQSAIG
jgi:hypothetical protein